MKLPPRTTPIRVNLAPMVDVTMCLLVFFMVTTKMVEMENSVIDLPLAKSAKDVDKQKLGKRFVVNVRDARLEGGKGARYLVQDKEIHLSEVIDRLQRERQVDPLVNCVIRADRSLPYQHVQAVMVGCARAGIQKVTFSAVPREGGGG